MYEKAIQEIENQIRIINQKLPSIEESIKTYRQMTNNYIKEKEEMLDKKDELEEVLSMLGGINYEEVSKNA